jgi:DNA repair protein RadC
MEKVLIKDLPPTEKPRERLLKMGVENLSNEDLISIILRTGTKNYSVKYLSNQVLSLFNNINEMKNIELNKLISIKGIGKTKGIGLIAALELGRRVYYEGYLNKKLSIRNGKDIYTYFKYIIRDNTQERFYSIYLDTKKNIIGTKLLFIGTVNVSTIHPREIFKHAYLLSASYIICIHNHPSGDITPSDLDKEITDELVSIGNIQKIPILDHIIIGNNNYYSFYENGEIRV